MGEKRKEGRERKELDEMGNGRSVEKKRNRLYEIIN